MSDGNFSDFITRERERLQAERETSFNQQHELEQQLAAINNEMRAIDAYEAAKSGKAPPPLAQASDAAAEAVGGAASGRASCKRLRVRPAALPAASC